MQNPQNHPIQCTLSPKTIASVSQSKTAAPVAIAAVAATMASGGQSKNSVGQSIVRDVVASLRLVTTKSKEPATMTKTPSTIECISQSNHNYKNSITIKS